jgi:hypothetical protein
MRDANGRVANLRGNEEPKWAKGAKVKYVQKEQ